MDAVVGTLGTVSGVALLLGYNPIGWGIIAGGATIYGFARLAEKVVNKYRKMQVTKLFYLIWLDLIRKMISNPIGKDQWKFYSNFIMSFCMAFNIFELYYLLNELIPSITNNIQFPNFTNQIKLNAILSFLLVMLPTAIINFNLVLKNNKYLNYFKLKYYNGKLFITYFIVSTWTPIVVFLFIVF